MTAKTMKSRTSTAETKLEDGVVMCGMPKCGRMLKTGQGKQTALGRVCFGHPEVHS
jgi:hypothetical protein